MRNYSAGRPKIKVYQYDKNGVYIQKWDSMSDVGAKYYEGNYPMFRKDSSYHILPDDTILLKERLGRDNIKRIFLRLENPLIFSEKDIKPVEVLNMDGDVIATFINHKALSTLTGLSTSQVWSYLNSNKMKELPKNKLKINVRYSDTP